jgi:WD40 repeat protein
MASPVLHKMLFGDFREGAARRAALEDVDGGVFGDVLDLWCGKEVRGDKALAYALLMASVADRLQMAEVAKALEDAIMEEIRVGTCAEALEGSRRLGLLRVEEAAWGMAVERFEEVCATAGFMGLDEETVGRLLEDDRLGVRREEAAFEGLVGWMKWGEGRGPAGRELMGKIRFGVMAQDYLECKVREALPEEDWDWTDGLIVEAVEARGALQTQAPVTLRKLGAKALTRRWGMGVDWGRYSGGGAGRRLEGHLQNVIALAECSGRMCSGSLDGSIRVWSMTTLEEERVLDNDGDCVLSLAVWEGELISGHTSGRIRVWDVASGERRRELEGHAGRVSALCVCGSRLASGSDERTIKVWKMGAGLEWACERTLEGHDRTVFALASWGNKLISGSVDRIIRVWDLSTGVLDATLISHEGDVYALAVEGKRLYSASRDGTIRVWDAGTWAEARSVAVYDADEVLECPRCLLTSGSKLISGSISHGGVTECEVRVWDLDTMACEHTFRQAAGDGVWCLAGAGAAVWGSVGRSVVVWGQD